MPSVEKLPKSIVRAICEIKQSLAAVSKSQKNQHGGYMFASTDDIYAALTRKMGEVGILVLALEDRCEIVKIEKDGKTVQWAHLEYVFVLSTEDDTWTDERARRSLYIQVTGPQTFQAAQSYAEKSYLRSLFKIPTGDMDLDSMVQGDSMESQHALNGNGAKRKSSSAAKKDGTDKVYNDIVKAIHDAPNTEVLQQIPELYCDEIATLPRQWAELYSHEYEDKMDALRAVAS